MTLASADAAAMPEKVRSPSGEVGEEGVDGEAEALEVIEDRIERARGDGRHVLEGWIRMAMPVTTTRMASEIA